MNSVVTWSQEGKLNLNAEKSEACPFSTGSNDSSWNPTIFTGTRRVRVNSTPCFIGVILDRSLTFNAQLKKLTTSLASRIHNIRATVHTSWGWRRSTLTMAFHALVCSKLNYAAPAWQPWLSVTNLSNLDCLQNHSLWLITGQLVSTSLEALWLEANVQSYSTCSKCLILKTNEKVRRSADDHPKCISLDVNVPQPFKVAQASLKKQNFRLSYHLVFNTEKTFISHLYHGSRTPLIPGASPPPSQVLPVELMTTTQNGNVAFPLSPNTRVITLSTAVDPLVEEQEMGVQLLSSLGDPLSSLM